MGASERGSISLTLRAQRFVPPRAAASRRALRGRLPGSTPCWLRRIEMSSGRGTPSVQSGAAGYHSVASRLPVPCLTSRRASPLLDNRPFVLSLAAEVRVVPARTDDVPSMGECCARREIQARLMHDLHHAAILAEPSRQAEWLEGVPGNRSARGRLSPPGLGQRGAAVSPICSGAPGGIRTPDLLIRSQSLYPLSYGRKATSLPEDDPQLRGVPRAGGPQEPTREDPFGQGVVFAARAGRTRTRSAS